METLRRALEHARQRRVAVGHFNVSELVAFKAITDTARELGVPVLVGASEGEREFLGVHEVHALVATLRETRGQAVFLNADHTHSLKKAEEAARAGFDEVLFDASDRSFDENVAQTRRAVEAVRSIDEGIVVEGEIGWIGASSEIHEQAGGLHGGSGTHDPDLTEAIRAGMTIVHINTELRLAWRRGLEAALARDPDAVTPYKILTEPLRAIEQVVRARLELFDAG